MLKLNLNKNLLKKSHYFFSILFSLFLILNSINFIFSQTVTLNATSGRNLLNENLIVNQIDFDPSWTDYYYHWKKNGASMTPSRTSHFVYFPFDGDTTKDYSGHNWDLNESGGLLPQTSGGPGNSGYYNFDGFNDYLINSNIFSLPTNSDFTISTWVRFSTTSGTRVIFRNHDQIHIGSGIGEASIAMDVHTPSDWIGKQYTGSLNNYQWRHVVYTWDQSEGNLIWYVDGDYYSSHDSTYSGLSTNPESPLVIGTKYGETWYWKGGLDDFRILNYILTPEKINVLYKTSLTPQTLDKDLTSVDDLWKVCVTPYNSNQIGSEICSSNVEIKIISIRDISPIVQTKYKIPDTIQISADILGVNPIDSVILSITLPNSTIQQYELTNIDTIYSLDFIPEILGTHQLSFFINDTLGNTTTDNSHYFYVVESVPPNVFDLIPTNDSSFDVYATIQISSNVTDTSGIDNAKINITYPNGTITQLNLTNTIGDKYNTSFQIPNLAGQYNITFIAEDTNENINQTQTTFFNINDQTIPQVFNISPTQNSSFNTSDTIQISTNVTDNIAVDKVSVNIFYPNGTIQKLNLTNSIGDKYNTSFQIPDSPLGRYNLTFIATDTSNNTNQTEQTYFNIFDDINPQFQEIYPIQNSNFNTSDIIQIYANITDNIAVDTVKVNIIYPNGTITELTLTNQTLNKFNNSFQVPNNLIGQYNISFIVNDTSNNINQTQTTYFNILDNINPQIQNFSPTQNISFNTFDIIQISSNVSDNIKIDSVKVNITYSNGTINQLTLTNSGGNNYNASFQIPISPIGRHNLTFIITDSSNNTNSSQTSYFNVFDNINPQIQNFSPTQNSNFNTSDIIQISTNVIDNIAVDTVKVKITYPNGTITELTLLNSIDNKYNSSFQIPTNLLGRYNISFIVNDTSSNLNQTVESYFNIFDNIPPQIQNFFPTENSTFNTNEIIQISTNITDNIEVDSVKVNITYPNGTMAQLTLTNVLDNNYNTSFQIPNNLLGQYNLTFISSDIYGNKNSSETSHFNTLDIQSPQIQFVENSLNSNNYSQNYIYVNTSSIDNIDTDTIIIYLYNQTNLIYSNSSTQDNYFINYSNLPNGIYYINATVNDTSNNINFTSTKTIVLDTNPPIIEIISPLNNSNASDPTPQIKFNITDSYSTILNYIIYVDNIEVSTNGDGISLNSIIETITITNSLNLSTHILVISATDSAGNSINSSPIYFSIVEPLIILSSPKFLEILPYTNITFKFNITDLTYLYSLCDLTIDNILNQSNINFTTNTLNNFTPVTLEHGTHNWTVVCTNEGLISANDTFSFTIDIKPPQIVNLTPSENTFFNTNQLIQISSDITDLTQINITYVNITYPNGTINKLNLTYENNNLYNTSFQIPELTGIYNLTFFANDSVNNINSTQTSYFVVGDATPPQVFDLIPIQNSTYNPNILIQISSNVTDNIELNLVKVNITYPNGIINQLTLTHQNNNLYNTSFTTPILQGRYNLTFIANDSSNNVNQTQTSYFNVLDTSNPNLEILLPTQNQSFNTNTIIEISSNVTDNIAVDTVKVNISYPNSTINTLTLTNTISDTYTTNFLIPNLIGIFNLTFFVNDTTGNINQSENTYINIIDTISPTINSVQINPSVIINGSSVNLSINSTDNVEIDSNWAIITSPNGSSYQLNNLPNLFSNSNQIGQYNVTFFTNDTSNNTVNSSSYFEVGENISVNINLSINTNSLDNSLVHFKIVHPIFGDTIYESLINESINIFISNILYDIVFFGAFNNSLNLTFHNVDLQNNSGKNLNFDKHKDFSNYVVTYAIDTDYTFNYSEIMFSYNDETYSSEDNLKLHKCDNYNITSRTCNSNWNDISTNSIQNKINNNFKYNTTSFSGFSIFQYVAPVDPDNGGSSGGGGGGGGGVVVIDNTSNTNETQPQTFENSGQLICNTGYYLSENKEICIKEQIQNQTQNISTISKIPEDLFDITFELNNLKINNLSQLAGIITFTNFGTTPTKINYTITLYDNNNIFISSFNNNITINTKNIISFDYNKFNNLNLSSGNYKIILTTNYGNNTIDEFIQNFNYLKERNFINLNNNLIIILILSISLISLAYLIKYLFRKSK